MGRILLLFALLGIFATCYGAGGSVGGGSSDSLESEAEDINSNNLVAIYIGRKFTLNCKSLNVTTGFRWYKNGSEIDEHDERYSISTENSTLSVTSAEASDVTKYRCESKEDYNKASEIRTYVLNFKRLPKSTTVQEGDKLSLVCETGGKPEPVVRWEKDNVALMKAVNDTSRVEFSANDKGTLNATLKIENLSAADFGKYTCLIYIYGMEQEVKNTTSYVRVKSIYAALWPFLGIVAEVVILCIVIFIYERKRMKSEYDESDTDQGQDQ